MKLNPRLLLVIAPTALVALGAILVETPFWRGLLIGLVLGPIPVVAAIAAGTFVLRRRVLAGRSLRPPPLPTSQWDYQLSLVDLNGNPIQSTAWAGRVLVLNFWATWCTPCLAEMPALRSLMEKTTDLGVQFAFISREKADIVRPFVAKKNWDIPVFLLADDPPDCFKGSAVPGTFIVDRSGTIVLRHFGAAAWDAEPVVSFVRGLAVTPS